MNGSSLLALALRDRDSDGTDPKAALREQLAKGNTPEGQTVIKKVEEDNEQDDADDKSDDEDDDGEKDDDEEEGEKEEVVEETAEQKAEREKQEKEAAKVQRKQDRVQKRIDNLTAAKAAAEAEVARLKAQLEADPDKKLTAEEVETRAEALAAKKLADKEMEQILANFEKACDKLQADARKADKEFDDNINDIATDVGPIPSFMIGVLEDLDNGGEVLAFIAKDDELAERIWGYINKPAKMTKELVEISNKLADAKKKPKKQISKVETMEPVRGSGRVNGSLAITEADTKNMESYVAKRQAQMLEKRKLKGF